MPGYPRYVASVQALPPAPRHQPPDLLDQIRRIARSFPAIRPRRVRVRRLVAALVSFVDDYEGPWPDEAFDDRAVAEVLAWLERQDGATIPELLASPGSRSAPTLLDAVLRVHAALRQLARGRDDRALPSSRRTVEERLRLAACVVPFAPELARGGDPLGDAYHYVATLAVGLAADPSAPSTLVPLPLFAVGPELMWVVRDQVSGSTLFFGNHARIDRLGLRDGARVGLSPSQET